MDDQGLGGRGGAAHRAGVWRRGGRRAGEGGGALSGPEHVGGRPDPARARLRVPAADPARRRLHQAPPPLRGSDRHLDRPRRRQRRLSALSSSDSPIVPSVPTITSHDQAKRSTPTSDSTSTTRFTTAMMIMAATLAPSLTGRRLSSPSRNTPRREPEVTPAILNTVHNI